MTSDWICNDTQSSANKKAAKSGGRSGNPADCSRHHEWWNGGGYPDALTAKRPIGCAHPAVADSYAAITDARPHRPAMSQSSARQHMAGWAGIEFDRALSKGCSRSAHYPNSNRSRSRPMQTDIKHRSAAGG